MPIPFPSQVAIASGEWPDTVIVYAPGIELDAEGSPDINTPGAAGTELACSVQEVAKGQGTTYVPGEAPHGLSQYEVLFPADPSITQAEQRVVWTAHDGVAFAVPMVLIATGEARPPHGLGLRWTASCDRHQ